ncbi:hypothetical protein LXA43DRAFT_1014138 [Ganoderma leucocontextum]|nr:hypothetical protein LXA43DRAFT_1014138 [Ganoderma leucocontextum]
MRVRGRRSPVQSFPNSSNAPPFAARATVLQLPFVSPNSIRHRPPFASPPKPWPSPLRRVGPGPRLLHFPFRPARSRVAAERSSRPSVPASLCGGLWRGMHPLHAAHSHHAVVLCSSSRCSHPSRVTCRAAAPAPDIRAVRLLPASLSALGSPPSLPSDALSVRHLTEPAQPYSVILTVASPSTRTLCTLIGECASPQDSLPTFQMFIPRRDVRPSRGSR